MKPAARRGRTPIKERITHVLDELRVVLPGTQALIGFQFVAIFSQGFTSLPLWARYVHLASLGLTTLTTVLLMAPAARHRIVEEGQDTEALHRFASRMLLVAMATLALGVCGDLFVVLDAVTKAPFPSLAVSLASLAGIYITWFGSFFLKPHPLRRAARRPTPTRVPASASRRPLLHQPHR
jgi:hypothetical protein